MKRLIPFFLLLVTVSCAGLSKDCSKGMAANFGADWIVVQLDMNGRPFNCWALHNVVLQHSDGGNLDWKDTADGHLVAITGWENRVQVQRGNWESAARIIGVDIAQCGNGRYPKQ